MNHKLITVRLFYQKVLSIMLPVALQQAINMGLNMLDTMMLGQMGEVQISASSIVTGHTIGEGDTERAMQQGYTFYLLSVAFGLIAVVMVLACGPLTIRVYSLTEETVMITEQMMRAYAVIVFFQCIQSVMTKGVLRGGGDTKFLMKADMLFMWLVSIPLGCIGGLVPGWPAWLTILCLRIDYVIKSVWCVTRLKSGKWIRSVEDASLPARN